MLDHQSELESRLNVSGSKVEDQSASQAMPSESSRYWIGVEELSADYWADPKLKEKRSQEFYEKPVESIALIDKLDTKGIARRDFLTVMGASMAMAGFACARRPVHKIIPYVVKPEEITPGVANWYASTLPETGEGILIKTREGRPIKLEGNPDHPVNGGAITARSQGRLLDLYDVDRLKAPLQKNRVSGTSIPTTWKEVDATVAGKLASLSTQKGTVKVLSSPIKSDSSKRLVGEFLSAFGSQSSLVEYDPLVLEEISQANELTYGEAVAPRYRFDRADFVVSLGSDFLGADSFSVENSAQWIRKRNLVGQDAKKAKMSKLVTFETMMTLTGANSDERFPVRTGDEFKVAMAIAHEIVVKRSQSKYASDSAVVQALSGYSADVIAKEIGLKDAEAIQKVAQGLWENKGKSLVVAGSLQTKTHFSLELQIVSNFLNSLLENDGFTVDAAIAPLGQRLAQYSAMEKLIQEMNSGSVAVLIISNSNPVYSLGNSSGFEEALKKVPLVIFLEEQDAETGVLSDYVLPASHFLESWGDSQVRKGIYSLQQPAIAPIHESRSLEEVLLNWTVLAKLSVAGLLGRVASLGEGSNTWHDYLKLNWKEVVFPKAQSVVGFEKFWESALRTGVVNLQGDRLKEGVSAARAFKVGALSQLPKFQAQAEASEGLKLVFYPKIAIGDGRLANNAWLQELPDPITTMTWDNYINLSPAFAKKLKVKNNDVVKVILENGEFELPVNVQPGLHTHVGAVAVGFGRTKAGKVGNKIGVNVYPFVTSHQGRQVFSGFTVKEIKKTGRIYKLAQTQWHHAIENRPIVNDLTLSEYQKNPAEANHTDPHLKLENVPTMWAKHEYKGYRWGMAIDLSSCTGCGACVVGCTAENNVPVVGRDQVRMSREMHWIRIDRYYSGEEDQPDVVFQPMLCQHCENAPCETVCPVIATMHGDEGTNEQIYNRCVGTRYCQNNCPYKTRRFNFFDHWKSYEGTLNMVWNPEVTVRTRGIMEKCTFCVQRIRDAKDTAKDRGVKVKDGDFKTACQQACPTEAITFGDINNPKSKVSQLKDEPRAFRSLEILNTRPAVSYLTKVRNKVASPKHHGGGHH